MNRNIQIVLTSGLTVLIVGAIKRTTSVSCPALYTFSDVSFTPLFIMVGIWLIGLLIFVKVKPQINVMLFFFLLTLISVHPVVKNIFLDLADTRNELKESICSKSQYNAMLCEMNKLTQEEYDYVMSSNANVLPSPPGAKDISIYYYHDDFLGEYILSISLELSESEKFDSLEFPKWQFAGQLENNNLQYVYHEGRD